MPKKYIDAELAETAMTKLYEEDIEMYAVEIPETFDKGRAISELQKIPAADIEEVRHGYWIPLENNEFQCSECRNRVASSNPSIDVTRDLHYCWNCGAKMDILFFEFFDKWKSDKIKEFQGTQDLCKHSAFDGMFGFSGWAGCNLHWDDGIHYGCKGCPENCPDFELADENILRERCSEDLRKQKEREERLR